MNSIDLFLKEISNLTSTDTFKLNKPATPKDFDSLKKKLNIKRLPNDFVELYSKFNGETLLSAGIIGNWRLLEIKNIIKEYELMQKLLDEGVFHNSPSSNSEYVKNTWWNLKWIPFVSSGNGHLICLDLDPNKKGTVGQIILFLHDNEKRPLFAKSIDKWFKSITKDLKKGKYKYDDMSFSNEAFVKSSVEAQNFLKNE